MPYRIAFFGTPQFAVPTLMRLFSDERFSIALVVTQPDKPSGRGQKMTMSPIKTLAATYGLPVLQPLSLRRECDAFISQMERHGPFDAAVVVAFGQIVPPAILDYFSQRVFNLHGSLLPLLRGAAPLQRSLIQGFTTSGVSVMRLNEGMDTGPVFGEYTRAIPEWWRYQELHDALSDEGAQYFLDVLPLILSGEKGEVAQDSLRATYAPKISREESLLSWDKSAITLHNLIRGLWPTPGAYFFYQGRRIKVARASVDEALGDDIASGTIARVDDSGIVVAVEGGNSSIRLIEIIPEGRRLMSAHCFAQGLQINPGTILR
jgi:methionyl-tRNA formyltransferase